MSTPDAFLWIHEDHARGLALIRGLNVKQVLVSTDVLDEARWSVAAKGYVVPLDALPNLCAQAECRGISYRIKQVVV
jgi:hypothetical protein